MRVLILNADPGTAADLTNEFRDHIDFCVVIAFSLEEAFVILHQDPCEAVLILITRDDDEGFNIANKLSEEFPSINIGFLMESLTAEASQKAAECSTLGVIEKPWTPEKLTYAFRRLPNVQLSKVLIKELEEAIKEGKTLTDFKLTEVIQMCCLNRKTGRLLVWGGDEVGSIYFREGAVVHAEAPGLEGEEAVYEMIEWETAHSALDETIKSPEVTISSSWERLLMESVRRKNQHGEGVSRNLRREASAENLMGKMVGPFQVHRKISSDKWGTLYEALQVTVNRPVALKVLNPKFYKNEKQVQQFISLAGAMARVQAPYLTAVYEAGRENGLIFYAREYVENSNLREHLQRGLVFPEELALRVIINIGETLNYEKKNKILHIPLLMDQVLILDTSVPKLFNNVTLENDRVSAGEADEICRLSAIVKEGMRGANDTSPEFKILLEKMSHAGEDGLNHWETLLHEARQLDFSRRAAQVLPPPSTAKTQKLPEVKPQTESWLKWTTFGAVLFGLGCFLWLYFVLHSQGGGGAKDVDVMVRIDGGPFIYQADEERILPSFYMDRYEVTIGQYRKFLEAWNRDKSLIQEHPQQRAGKDHTPNDWAAIQAAIENRSLFRGTRVFDNMPVFDVDYFDAWAYARWAGKRLPTEQEWEKAGRGPKGRLYPWGNTFDPTKANIGVDQESARSNFGRVDSFGIWAPVGSKRDDCSVYRVMDMAGNVSEWTDSWDINPDFPTEKVPVVRGGAWASMDARLTTRQLRQSKLKRSPTIGFRCVADISPPRKQTRSN